MEWIAQTKTMRIGEMAETTGVSARMLRYYEKLGLIEPGARTSAGYRIYDDADLEIVFHIEGLRGLGLSLTEVKSALDNPGHGIAEVIDELITESRARLREEKRLYDQLLAVRESAVTDSRAALNVMNLLKNLRSHDPAARQDSALRLAPAAHPRMVARSAIAEKDLNVAGALSWSMLQAGDVALEEVLRALASRDKEVRMRAVRILAEAAAGTIQPERSAEIFEYLRGALEDEDTDIRATAALAVGERGGRGAFNELFRMVVDGDHDVQASEILAQSPSWHEAALDKIGVLLNDDRTQEQRARLVQALAEFDDSDELLLDLLDDSTPVVALTAKAIVRTRGNMP